MSESYIQRYSLDEEENFTIISNALIQNHNLSFRARGLLCYFLSLPKDWKISISHLKSTNKKRNFITVKRKGKVVQTQKIESDLTLREALKEIEKEGYAKTERVRDKEGKFISWVTYISSKPIFTEQVTIPPLDYPALDNQTLQSKEEDKEIISNNHGDEKNPHSKIAVRENVFLTTKQLETLKSQYSSEELEFILNKLSKYKEEHLVEYSSDYHAINRWVIKALEQRDKKKEINKAVKENNIRWLTKEILIRERRNVRGILKFNEDEAYDTVLNKRIAIDNPRLIEIVTSWY